MRQGLILFADALQPGSAAAQALKSTLDAALKGAACTPFVAYAENAPTQILREITGGPPPRFFPQASRTRLGERFAQALAFLFIQDYDRVVLLSPGYLPVSEAQLVPLFAALDEHPLWVDEKSGAYGVAVRRDDFPAVAVVFDEVPWEKPGARDAAAARLAVGEI